MLRAVIDTNVWVSGLLNRSGAPARVRLALEAGRFTLVMSQPLLDELSSVLSRPRIMNKYGLTRTDVSDLLALLRQRAALVSVRGQLKICRDPDDDAVIETAVRGNADVLVTRDDDLKGEQLLVDVLALLDIRVLSVQHFLEALREEGTEP